MPEPAPFTVDHFREWASGLVLDSGKAWVLEDWQTAFVADVFLGIPENWLVVPEGNGKTTLVAGLALYHAEHTPDAWVTVAASSRDQARILYRQAKGFVTRTERLGTLFRCFDGYRRIDYRAAGSQIEVFAADERTGDGVIPTLAILDELHRHRTLELYLTWCGKLDKRQGQILIISTAGEPGSEFEEARERIRQLAPEVERRETFVRAVSPQVVLHEWAVPEAGDVDDFDLVARANPFSGVTEETLRRKRGSPTMTVGHWRRFNCNLPTRSTFAAITEKEWYAAETDEEIPEGEGVWVGLDVGWKWDTTAAVPLWMRDREYRLFGPARVHVPPRDGVQADVYLIERLLVEIHERNSIHTVVMDISNANDIAAWIEAEIGATVIERPQTIPANVEEFETFMEALRNGQLLHNPSQEFTRHALNAIARILPRGDAIFERPARGQRGPEQDNRVIDALKAAAMVHYVAATMERPSEEPLIAWA